MSLEQAAQSLRATKNELEKTVEEKTRELNLAKQNLEKIARALEEIEGTSDAPTKSVPMMVEMAGRKLTEGKQPGFYFDHADLVQKAQEMFPGDDRHKGRIKTGVYSAVAGLIKQKKFQRVPGGLALIPES